VRTKVVVCSTHRSDDALLLDGHDDRMGRMSPYSGAVADPETIRFELQLNQLTKI
jgi:hypothetical protein